MAEKVGKRFAKGWQRVGKGLAKGWRWDGEWGVEVGGFVLPRSPVHRRTAKHDPAPGSEELAHAALASFAPLTPAL